MPISCRHTNITDMARIVDVWECNNCNYEYETPVGQFVTFYCYDCTTDWLNDLSPSSSSLGRQPPQAGDIGANPVGDANLDRIDELLRQYQQERSHAMPPRPNTPKPLSSTETISRVGITKSQWNSLPVKVQSALMEATSVLTVAPPNTGLTVWYCHLSDDNGDDQSLFIAAPDVMSAIDRYSDYQDYDADTLSEYGLQVYKIPKTATDRRVLDWSTLPCYDWAGTQIREGSYE